MLKKITGIAILLVFVLVVFIYVRSNINEFKNICNINPLDFAFLSFLVLLTMVLNGLVIKVITAFFKIKLTCNESFGLSVVNTFASYIPFRAGLAVKAVYLKKVHNFPYTTFVSTVGATYIITFLCCGLCGMIVLLVGSIVLSIFSPALFIIFTVIFLSGLSFIILPVKVSLQNSRLGKHVSTIISGWNLVRTDKKTLLKITGISISTIFVHALRISYASHILKYDVPFIYSLIIALLGMISIFIAVTPGALGIREAVMGFSSKLLGETTLAGVVIGSLDRAVALVWVIMLGSIFTWLLSKQILLSVVQKHKLHLK